MFKTTSYNGELSLFEFHFNLLEVRITVQCAMLISIDKLLTAV